VVIRPIRFAEYSANQSAESHPTAIPNRRTWRSTYAIRV
jgi:hypothetical protein